MTPLTPPPSPSPLTLTLTIVVNGTPTDLPAGATVATAVERLATRLGRDPGGAGVAVARNGEVVPRRAWPDTPLADADRVEILGATQGG